MALNLHTTYLRTLVIVSVAVVMAVAVINRAVNPYGLFAKDLMPGADRPETFTHLRLVKAAQVRHLRPQSLILGSSRAETGLDPAHPAWQAKPVYNLGLSNASLYEIKRYFQHACALGKVRQVVLLLDFAAFLPGAQPAPDFTENRLAVLPDGAKNLAWDSQDLISALLTWDAWNGSLATWIGREGEKRYLPDGSRDASAEDKRVLAKGGAVRAFAAYERRLLSSIKPTSAKGSLGENELQQLRDMIHLARQMAIDLRLAIAPMHVRYQEIQRMQGYDTLYETWKRTLVSILKQEAEGKGNPFPLYDFGVYSDETIDPIPAKGLARYYYEASHFNKALGNRLLGILLAPTDHSAINPAGNFGHRLTEDSLQEHLLAVQKGRAQWAENHAQELAALEAAMPQGTKANRR